MFKWKLNILLWILSEMCRNCVNDDGGLVMGQ